MITSNRWKLLAPAILALALNAHSAPIAIANHSFENPAIPTNSFSTSAAPPGWTAFGSAINYGSRTVGVLNPIGSALYYDPVPHGSNVAVVFLWDNTTNPAIYFNLEVGLRQSLTNTLRPHTRYTLLAEVGNIAPITAPWDFTGFPNYRIDLLAGTNIIASDNNTLLPAEGRFLTATITLVTATSHPFAGQPLGIRIANLNAAPGVEVNFDNIRLDATPEPALLSGLLLTETNAQLIVTNLAPGFTHNLQRTTDPVATNWTHVTNLVTQALSTNLNLPLPAATQTLYRIQSE